MPSTEPRPAPLSLEELTDIALGRDRMSFTDLYLGLEGRVSRRTFWLHGVVALLVVAMVAVGLLDAAGLNAEVAGGLVNLALAWPVIAVSAKRWHDYNRSGWWALVNLVPPVGWLVSLALNGFIPGTPGPNRFGPDPLAPRPHPVNTSR
jgi:uncharacterized membrane protein YhaH (DUF805 family)